MKRLTILGSTGSIGRTTLQIVARFPQQFTVRALTAHRNVDLLAGQVRQFQPQLAVVADADAAGQLEKRLPPGTRTDIASGDEGLKQAATLADTEMVVAAIVGAAGLIPTLAAVEAGKDIALANKETLVMAGELVMEAVRRRHVRLHPVDSEHSAIFQCLIGNRREDLDKILLTASGGPFLNRSTTDMAGVTPEEALRHPNWDMGAKITIDSATLMNKGLEVIEAKWLFGLEPSQIEVLVHPQSIVHSMVAYRDGSVMAQMGIPDMKSAIAYALTHPERLPLAQALPAFASIGALTFQDPDLERFPCLALAFDAIATGDTLPAVMNAANEVAVGAFLHRRISFDRIAALIRDTMAAHVPVQQPDLEEILAADEWARQTTHHLINKERF